MVKIKIKFGNNTRTFYTRKDWKKGKKLYIYRPRASRCTGNWYTDPNYQHWSWQDYEREYARQQREGLTDPLTSNEIKMKEIVEKYNDEILTLANQGIKRLNLEKFLENLNE